MGTVASNRRWFQIRLSTWCVLVAILAWALAEWPWVRLPEVSSAPPAYQVGSKEVRLVPWKPPYREPGVNPDLLYPVIALVAFVGWKAARTVAASTAERV